MSRSVKIPNNEKRSWEQLKEHYKIEKELASRLLNSTKQERQYLYTDLYDELYRRVPHHSQLTRKLSPEKSAMTVAQRMQLLEKFLTPQTIFLEVGAGDCSLSIEVSKRVKKVYVVEVSKEITKQIIFPDNVEFILSDGFSIPVPENSVHVAYSHQLMEHLHPDDAIEQLQNIYKALAPKGIYICITPNRFSGPHDISQYFDQVATGFHLKEYTVTELYQLFSIAGFSQISWFKNKDKLNLKIPLISSVVILIKLIEKILNSLPFSIRKTIANTPMLFRGMTILGRK